MSLTLPSAPLYDLLAPRYEEHFAAPHRVAYDTLAWELCSRWLPEPPANVVDVGCGIGRWAKRLTGLGYTVLGIEPAPIMAQRARERMAHDKAFRLLQLRVEQVDLPAATIDAVVAIGSLQYTDEPADVVHRMAGWLRPGGVLAILVDSLAALVLELVTDGREEEAYERARERRGVWTEGGLSADLHLLDAAQLAQVCLDAGLEVVGCHGLLVGTSLLGRTRVVERLERDFVAQLEQERAAALQPDLADLGKQLFVVARRPVG